MDDRLNPAVPPTISGRLSIPPLPPPPQPRDHYAAFERQARVFGGILKQATGYWFNAVGAKAAKGYASPVVMHQLRRKLDDADVAWVALRKSLVAMLDSLEDRDAEN